MRKPIERIAVGNVGNARDLGGLHTLDGREIKPNRLIRSSDLSLLYPELADALVANHPIRQVIDLRTAEEVQLNGDINIEEIAYSRCPIGGETEGATTVELPERYTDITNSKVRTIIGDCLFLSRKYLGGDSEDAAKAMELRYREFVTSEESISGLKKAVGEIIDLEEGATLFHSSSGKDRTGVLAYLLLLILGVKEEDAIQDYLLSNRFLNSAIKKCKSLLAACKLNKSDPRMYESAMAIQGVRRSWIEAVKEEIDAKGGIEAYFRNVLGFQPEQIALLRERYLQTISKESETPGRQLLIFSLDTAETGSIFSYVLTSDYGAIMQVGSFDPSDIKEAPLQIAELKAILKAPELDIVTYRAIEEIDFAKRHGLVWLENILSDKPIFDLSIALESFNSGFKKISDSLALYEKLVGYSQPKGKSDALLLLDSFAQMIRDLADCPDYSDSIHDKKYQSFYLTISEIDNYLKVSAKDAEFKTAFIERIENGEIDRLVAFDIECSNTYCGQGKICEFGSVIAKPDGTIESSRETTINPGRGNRYDFNLIGRKREKDLHLKYEANDYAKYRQSKEFGEYADNIRFLFEHMPNTLYFGFAVSNDLSYLNYSYHRYKLDPLKGLFVFDVQRIYKELYGKNPALEKVAEDFLEKEDFDRSEFHSSVYDAEITVKILSQFLKRNNQNIRDLLLTYGQSALICNQTFEALRNCRIPRHHKQNQFEKNPYWKRGAQPTHSQAHEFLSTYSKNDNAEDLLSSQWDGKRIGIAAKLKSTRIWKEVFDKIIEDGYRYVNDTKNVDIMLCADDGDCRRIGEAISRPIKRVIYESSKTMEQMIAESVYSECPTLV